MQANAHVFLVFKGPLVWEFQIDDTGGVSTPQLTLSLSHTHTLTLSLSHTHTDALSLSHTRTQTSTPTPTKTLAGSVLISHNV